MQKTSCKGSDLSKKQEWGHRVFKRVKHVSGYKNTHHHCICLYFLLSAIPLNILAFETPLPLGISNVPLQWGYGYFLEPHSLTFLFPLKV